MALLKIPRSYDMVLEFETEPTRKRFLLKLETFMSGLKKSVEMSPVYTGPMLDGAETKERRQKKLEHFFREAYALTFGQKYVQTIVNRLEYRIVIFCLDYQAWREKEVGGRHRRRYLCDADGADQGGVRKRLGNARLGRLRPQDVQDRRQRWGRHDIISGK